MNKTENIKNIHEKQILSNFFTTQPSRQFSGYIIGVVALSFTSQYCKMGNIPTRSNTHIYISVLRTHCRVMGKHWQKALLYFTKVSVKSDFTSSLRNGKISAT